jgi:hypothetical protein
MQRISKVLNSSVFNVHFLLEERLEAEPEAIQESLVAEVLHGSRRSFPELRRLFATEGECESEFGLWFVLVPGDSESPETHRIFVIECIGEEDDARSRPMGECLRFHHRFQEAGE